MLRRDNWRKGGVRSKERDDSTSSSEETSSEEVTTSGDGDASKKDLLEKQEEQQQSAEATPEAITEGNTGTSGEMLKSSTDSSSESDVDSSNAITYDPVANELRRHGRLMRSGEMTLIRHSVSVPELDGEASMGLSYSPPSKKSKTEVSIEEAATSKDAPESAVRQEEVVQEGTDEPSVGTTTSEEEDPFVLPVDESDFLDESPSDSEALEEDTT